MQHAHACEQAAFRSFSAYVCGAQISGTRYILPRQATSGHRPRTYILTLNTQPVATWLCHVARRGKRRLRSSALVSTRMLLAVAVVLNMSFAELPMPLGARVPDGAFGRSSSRATLVTTWQRDAVEDVYCIAAV